MKQTKNKQPTEYRRRLRRMKFHQAAAAVGKRAAVLIGILAVVIACVVISWICWKRTGTIVPTAELLDGKPTFTFLDVGQGDCTLIRWQGSAVLIDAGPTASGFTAAEYLQTYAPVIDCMIVTHPHEDHMGGAAEVLETVKIRTLILPAVESEEAFYRRALDAAEEQGTNVLLLEQPLSFSVGGIAVDILDTFELNWEDMNNASLVTRVEADGRTLLVTGDAEAEEEAYLLETSADLLDCDLLKIGHHGSASSSGEAFLEAVTPEICVISVGRGNSYGHPSYTVLERLAATGAEVHRTDREGTVVIH